MGCTESSDGKENADTNPADSSAAPPPQPSATPNKKARGPRCLVLDCGRITNADSGRADTIRRHVPAELSEEFCRVSRDLWDEMKVHADNTEDEFWRRSLEICAVDPALIDTIKPEIHETLRHTYPESLEVLRRARSQGIPVGMISNHTSWWFKVCAESARLYELIPEDLVVVSCDAGCCKPDADIYKFFLKRLEAAHPGLTASDCIFVDDKEKNVLAAKSLGFIGLRFDAAAAEPGELMRQLKLLGMSLE